MAYYKIFFVLILITNILLIHCGLLELTAEKLVGGEPADIAKYQYHVGIIGKYNGTHTLHIACSAGILSDIHLISAAECFFDTLHDLMKIRYYAVLASFNLKNDAKNAKEIIFIYALTDKPLLYKHRIVVLQLEDTLNLNINHYLKKLTLPDENTRYDLEARIAGYGFSSLVEKQSPAAKTRPKITSTRDFILMWAPVKIVDSEYCQISPINSRKEFCGRMKQRQPLDRRGLCSYEEGAPLVIGENLLVAISNKNRQDCDNTKYGNVYTSVFYYLDFIKGILQARHVPEVKVHRNRKHGRLLQNFMSRRV